MSFRFSFSRILAGALVLLLAGSGEAMAQMPRQDVWFAPTGGAPDELQLFQQPDLWAQARSRIGVIKLGPTQVRDVGQPPINSYNDLVRVDAFRKLREWNIDLAVETAAFDYTKCTPESSEKDTLGYINSVNKAGGRLRFIAMQEPLIAGLKTCHLGFDETVQKTAAYANFLATNPQLKSIGAVPEIGDIEPYPQYKVADIEHWADALKSAGVPLRFFHLDVNIHRLDDSHEANINSDFKELERYFRAQHIPFGVILWPGYDPIQTDREYYTRTMSWIKRIHQAIGHPDQAVFQTWVTRAGAACLPNNPQCTNMHPMCESSDGPSCGKLSIPLNVPESGPGKFTNTKLVNDGLAVFDQP